MSTEYKILRNITAAEVYDASDNKLNSCFLEEFQSFLHWAVDYYTKQRGLDQFYFFHDVPLSHLQKEFEKHPAWEKYLIKKGFIREVVPEIFYSVGDNFIYLDYSPHRYKLNIVAEHKVLLIAEDGCYFFGTPPVQVKDTHKITEKEFILITRNKPHLFTKEEKPK